MTGTATLGLRTVLVNTAAWDGRDDLPDDAVIVNASRPLAGVITWEGRFRHGIFYAAAPQVPGGPDPAGYYRWREDDAWQVVFITNEQIEALVLAKFAEYGHSSAEEAGVTIAEQAACMQLPWHDEPMTGQEIRVTVRQMLADWEAAAPEDREQALLVAERGADRAEAALLGTTSLTWRRLTSGNWGAFGEGWFYLAGKLGQRWFLESWAADRDAVSCDPRDADEAFGFRRLGDAQAEAAEREEVAGLLRGKFGMPLATAHQAMAAARRQDEFDWHRWGVRLAVDKAGYTVEVLAGEGS